MYYFLQNSNLKTKEVGKQITGYTVANFDAIQSNVARYKSKCIRMHRSRRHSRAMAEIMISQIAGTFVTVCVERSAVQISLDHIY